MANANESSEVARLKVMKFITSWTSKLSTKLPNSQADQNLIAHRLYHQSYSVVLFLLLRMATGDADDGHLRDAERDRGDHRRDAAFRGGSSLHHA